MSKQNPESAYNKKFETVLLTVVLLSAFISLFFKSFFPMVFVLAGVIFLLRSIKNIKNKDYNNAYKNMIIVAIFIIGIILTI